MTRTLAFTALCALGLNAQAARPIPGPQDPSMKKMLSCDSMDDRVRFGVDAQLRLVGNVEYSSTMSGPTIFNGRDVSFRMDLGEISVQATETLAGSRNALRLSASATGHGHYEGTLDAILEGREINTRVDCSYSNAGPLPPAPVDLDEPMTPQLKKARAVKSAHEHDIMDHYKLANGISTGTCKGTSLNGGVGLVIYSKDPDALRPQMPTEYDGVPVCFEEADFVPM